MRLKRDPSCIRPNSLGEVLAVRTDVKVEIFCEGADTYTGNVLMVPEDRYGQVYLPTQSQLWGCVKNTSASGRWTLPYLPLEGVAIDMEERLIEASMSIDEKRYQNAQEVIFRFCFFLNTEGVMVTDPYGNRVEGNINYLYTYCEILYVD